MKEQGMKKIHVFLLPIIFLFFTGCNIRVISEENKREIPFVILGQDVISEEVKQLIESRKEEQIKLTYVDEEKRYIIIGYGKQKTGGYSIYIEDLYATDNAIIVDTALVAPKKKEEGKKTPSYPVMVIQISEMALPVVFR